MKKKILFIIGNLETGGVSKSITSLMNVIDRSRYDVSLMVVSPHGALKKLLPVDLRLITNPVCEALVSGLNGGWKLLKSGHPLIALGHMCRLVMSTINKAAAGQMIAKLMPGIDETFDTIVDFNGQHQLYYMIDKLKSHKKITFFHSDYAKWPYYYSADKKYFAKVDQIFTVSNQCVESLKKWFPEQSVKINLMENISSLELIESMADYDVEDMDASTSLLTIGHVCENKGIYWVIEAASILKQRGVDFVWYFLGSVDKPGEYERLINNADVADRIKFLGIRTNPYPYIKKAEIVVHPSKYEGKSIALDEAKLLCKPVVATNFSTVFDQFSDRKNASICQMTPQSIADTIEELLTDEKLRQSYVKCLTAERHDNSSEIRKLYAIFDD